MIRHPLGLIGSLLAFASALLGQGGTRGADDLAARGIAAYHALEYDAAAALLGEALAMGAGNLSARALAETYMYLGATALFRGRPEDATDAFHRAMAADPRHRPDSLVFPPEVTRTFDAVRRGTFYVSLEPPGDTVITPGEEFYAVRLYASAPHQVAVDLAFGKDGEDAPPEPRQVYEGPMGDSLVVKWDGLQAADGGAVAEGRVVLRITSRSPAGESRTVDLPLVTVIEHPDTLPHPPQPEESSWLTERRPAGPAVRTLVLGALTGATAFALPALISDDGTGTPARYGVGAALSLMGVVGFFARRPGEALPANIAANRALHTWRQEVEAVRAENKRRLGSERVRIRPGEAVAQGRKAP